ncbi:hypothetical protein [Halobacterium salinarum]|uniref:Coiled-coil protein n=1 Tax=Halobacterium salinarum (strain ATCC 29341 / DSM 671 / R1) TaxID=478009 RepID=B0R9A4_HALS3|nr:hypothetical protein [Halobacterium salinarum]CAP15409.2 coiled-coil protein [Halobacterium salinarum R1]
MRSDSNVSVGAWAVAGVPLLVTLIQTVLALLDWTSQDLGVNSVLAPVFDIDVIFEAAVVFKQQPALVTVLFLLIAAAWIVQGAAMRIARNRDVAVASAGFASVTYLALFFGVYSSLFGRGIGIVQLGIFFAIPVVSSVLLVGAAFTHDWSSDVVDRASGELGDLEVAIEDARDAFDTAFETEVGDLDALSAVAPSGVSEARAEREGFHEQCDDLLSEVHSLEGTEDATRLQSEVSRLEARVKGLEPEDEVDRIAGDLRRRVESGIRTEFGGFSVTSRFGGSYTLSNLPTEYREVALPPDDGAVHVEDLGDVLVRRLETGDPLSSLATAVSAATAHYERVEEFVAEREDDIADRVDDVLERLDTVEEQVGRLPEGVRERVRDVLVENRDEAVAGAAAIQRDLRDAKSALHDCKFDEGDRLLDSATKHSRTLVTAAEFLRSLAGRLDHGGTAVDIPRAIDESVVEAVAPAFESHYDTDVVVSDGRVKFGGGHEPGNDERAASGNPSPEPELGDDDGEPVDESASEQADHEDEKRPEEVLDSALYFLRELEEHARQTDDQRVQFQTGDLPPGIGTPATLSNVERFLAHQSDLFEEVTLQSTETPSFLEVVVADEVRPGPALRTARERFIERYD